MTVCPKCRYERTAADTAHPGVCPACGIAYIQWLQAKSAEDREFEARERAAEVEQRLLALEAAAADKPDKGPPALEAFDVPVGSVWQRVHHYTCFMPSDGHVAAFWAHVVVYILAVIWGLGFIAHGVDWLWIGAAFLHNINLPFHEYGHVMFGVFGTFWMFLGGSLFQILLPLVPMTYFIAWQRDNFAASMMLWWCGQNFIDVSPYIADAQLRAIPLTTGNDESHDWWNLLSMTNSLEFADLYASRCFLLGAGVILLSLAWGGYLLTIEFRGRARPEGAINDSLN